MIRGAIGLLIVALFLMACSSNEPSEPGEPPAATPEASQDDQAADADDADDATMLTMLMRSHQPQCHNKHWPTTT